MNSSLEVESLLGKEPLHPPNGVLQENPRRNRPPQRKSSSPQDQSSTEILLAEDTTLNRWLVRNMITTVIPDAVVLEAENGHEAVELFLQENSHLVLMDLQMPGKDGYEATRRSGSLKGRKRQTP
ncbi:hypothetical protein MASR2M79_01600 [Aminivibrio sp.]